MGIGYVYVYKKFCKTSTVFLVGFACDYILQKFLSRARSNPC